MSAGRRVSRLLARWDGMARIRCPVCGRSFEPGATPAMPFCSNRCRQIGFGRWLDERYAFPSEAKEEQPQETAEAEPPAAAEPS